MQVTKRRRRRDRTPPASIGVSLAFVALFGGLAVFFVIVGSGFVDVLIADGAGQSVGIARPTPVWFALIGLVLGVGYCVEQVVSWVREIVRRVRANRGAGARHP